MKRKFAVAAATAALITASLSFTAFATGGDDAGADLTVKNPAEATDDQKDNVTVTVDPAGDEITAKTGKFLDNGFIKINGKVYFVKASTTTKGKIEELTDKFYEDVSQDGGSNGGAEDTTKTIYLENGKIVAAKIVKVDGKEKVLNEDGDAFVTATAAKGAEIKTVTLKSGNTTTTVDYLIAADGHIVKGWEELDGVTTIGNAGAPATVATSKQWFYAKADGTPVKDTWVSTAAGRWFFVGGNGVLVTATNAAAADDETKLAGDGWTVTSVDAESATIAKDGKTYIIDKTGLWVTGWSYDVQNKDWYYYNETTANGWVKLGTKWIYLTNYMAAQDEVKTIAGSEYAFDKDCYMITGFGKVTVDPDDFNSATNDGDEYVANVYANEKGVLQDGYQTIGGVDYFFETDLTATATVAQYAATKGVHENVKDLDGDTVDDDIMTDSFGKVIADWWIKLGDDWYYVNDKKVVVKNDWVAYGKNAKCFMGADGVMKTGGVYKVDAAGKITTAFNPADLDGLTGIDLQNALNLTVVINEAGAAATKDGWVVLTRDEDNNVTWGFAKNGKAYHGWVSDKGLWYYIDGGKLVTDSIVDGKYYVDENGVWTSGKTK